MVHNLQRNICSYPDGYKLQHHSLRFRFRKVLLTKKFKTDSISDKFYFNMQSQSDFVLDVLLSYEN